MFLRLALSLSVLILVTACASKEPTLMQAASSSTASGPDEFSITTHKPLQDPESFAALPQPTPLGSNLADIDPQMDVAIALGGRVVRNTGPAQSSFLLAHASRFGFTPNIRTQLAAEDLEFRKKNRGKLMERLFAVNVYYESYSSQTLDSYAELDRLRGFGIATPAAPPFAQ